MDNDVVSSFAMRNRAIQRRCIVCRHTVAVDVHYTGLFVVPIERRVSIPLGDRGHAESIPMIMQVPSGLSLSNR